MIICTTFDTPLGKMLGCATDKEICLLSFIDPASLEVQILKIKKLLKEDIVNGKHPFLSQLIAELDEYFEGERKVFTVPLHPQGTDFQKMVWNSLQQIPFGVTRSYKQQSRFIGNPDAIRAVASANGKNPIAIVIPCHRVIGEDGSLTGYAAGITRKRWLLDHEREGQLTLL